MPAELYIFVVQVQNTVTAVEVVEVVVVAARRQVVELDNSMVEVEVGETGEQYMVVAGISEIQMDYRFRYSIFQASMKASRNSKEN